MIKRIYAVVSDKEFYLFRKVAYAENLMIGEAMTKLVIAYGKGEISLDKKRKKEKKEVPPNKYMIDHQQIEGGN